MNMFSQEHYELMSQFEKDCCPGRKDREPKSLWPSRIFYQDGAVNELFKAYQHGYAFAKASLRLNSYYTKREER